MKALYQDLKWFLEQKLYMFCIILTAACSYGFQIVHPVIGIDDTAVELYLQDGLEVVMGRWTLFLINRVFPVAEFAPFMLELVGVIFLTISSILFCVLMKNCIGEKDSKSYLIAYTVFACVLISNPIISEVFIYFYHNGSGLAYILTALALIVFEKTLEKSKGNSKAYLLSMILAWIAIGCYESFVILYILGVIVILFLHGVTHPEKLKAGMIFKSLSVCAVQVVACIVLRGIMIALLTEVFHLHAVEGIKAQRSLLEMSALLGEDGVDTLIMLIKRYYVVYFVNGVCYLPSTGNVFATFVIGLLSIVLAIKYKKVWYPILWCGMLLTPFLLTLATTEVTLYRSCQYLPFYVAVGAFLLSRIVLSLKRGRICKAILVIVAMAWVFNQSSAMNKSFYIDYLKYEHTKEVLGNVAYEVKKNFGTEKPILFVGHYDVPQEFLTDYYVGYGSKEYQWIVRLTDPIDPHLKEKYYTPYGYSFVGEAAYPFIEWGLTGFDGTNHQMIRFLEMHGHSFETITDLTLIEEAKEIGDTMPRWPREGSIAEQEEYILIHM